MTAITIERVDDSYHFRASNAQGTSVDIDSIGDREGEPVGVGPMEMLLMALGGCSGIDIVMILTKGRQRIDSFTMRIEGDRSSASSATPYASIHAHYELKGDLEPAKVLRAVRLSHEKYCSVVKNLEDATVITYACSVNGERYE